MQASGLQVDNARLKHPAPKPDGAVKQPPLVPPVYDGGKPRAEHEGQQDGLYRVVTQYFVAGFVLERGVVTRCAPILRKRIDWWKSQATWIGP